MDFCTQDIMQRAINISTLNSSVLHGVPAICKLIPSAKVKSICHMTIFIYAASENVCAMPKSMCNMGNCICHMFTFIILCANLCVTCGI